jgi:hypothetical protein
MSLIYSGVKHYGLVMKDTPEWNRTIQEAKQRDSNFLSEYVECRAIPWSFEFQNVKYTMTCSIDMVLMTLFLLRQRKMITEKVVKMASSGMESILELIEKGSHSQARYSYLENIFTHRSPRFATNSKKGDNPFDCIATVMDMSSYCPLFVFAVKITKEKSSKCQCLGGVETKKGKCKVGTFVCRDISCPQEIIINAKGYNGKVALPCPTRILGADINLDSDDDEPTDLKAISTSCMNAQMKEIAMDPTPWILAINCDGHFPNQRSPPTGWTPCHHCSNT